MHVALTIAGSDSGGGAGIQADLKTFAAFGVFGTSAITAITAQNTVAVTGVLELPAEMVAKQIDAVFTDFGVAAGKTGMLASARIIETVAERIKHYNLKKLVVDPVMVSKSGHPLLEPEATATLIKKLLPLARVTTPNLPEAEVIIGKKLSSEADRKEAARKIFETTGAAVVLKGGHLSGSAVDIYYDGTGFKELFAERVETKNTHGTGCTFSAAIAANLALGLDLWEACRIAKEYITQTLKSSVTLGHGFGPVNHFPQATVPFHGVEMPARVG